MPGDFDFKTCGPEVANWQAAFAVPTDLETLLPTPQGDGTSVERVRSLCVAEYRPQSI
jgi:hypothetical protein